MNVLNENVLVLNKFFSPISVTTVKDAIIKLFTEKAEVVTVEDGRYATYNFTSWIELSELRQMFDDVKEDDDFINSVRCSIIAPRVIKVNNYDKVNIKSVRLSRKNVLLRDQYRCQYCNEEFPAKELNIDHVVPKSRGGKTIWENVVASCYDCNNKKGNKTPNEAGMKLKREAFKPKFIPAYKFTPSKRYDSWSAFIDQAYWNVELED
jgi:5-methylcytosine-specific restriction endonuclease McrA